jgi:molybdopterin molybdotransferase
VINSNAWAIAAACRRLGCAVRLLGIAADTLADHVDKMAVDDVDVLITIGGVSMGSHDFVRPALEALGASLQVWKLAMRPGKPLAFATLPRARRPVLVFGLPGNPVSSLVTFVSILTSMGPLVSHQLSTLRDRLSLFICSLSVQSVGLA